MPELAIIGGTGVYDPAILAGVRDVSVQTPYGEVGCKVGTYKGKEVAFLARHGAGHTVPPHLVNYRGNIWALGRLGAQRIIATAAVGTLNRSMAPGDFVLCDQFLDYTRGRPSTFFTGGDLGVVHTDFTEPYCPQGRAVLKASADQLGIRCHDGGTYVCTEGPRFETPAEIKAFATLGGDLVGMTGVPEVCLARELGLCYNVIAMCTNWAAGISPTKLTHEEVLAVMADTGANLRRLIMQAIEELPAKRTCECSSTVGKMPGLTGEGDKA